MFMLGIVLYGTTVLLPLFMQTLLGYTAEEAGSGADARRIHRDAVHARSWFFAQKRADARYLVAHGFICICRYRFSICRVSICRSIFIPP